MREEHEFDKLWCNLDREAEQEQQQQQMMMMILQQKKRDSERKKRTKKEQLDTKSLSDELDGLKVEEDTSSHVRRRRSGRSKKRSNSPTFDPAESLSDLEFDDYSSGVPGISGTALSLISDMHAPSRSSVRETTMVSKKRRPTGLKPNGRTSSFKNKEKLTRTLQSPHCNSSGAPVQRLDGRLSDTKLCKKGEKETRKKVPDDLMILKAISLKTKIAW
mmetsp:Transcript_2891/g.4670  ORF Transcript_2891/g.4670 Transcript_2891/m.4670 type:complete len:218 (-) Transcript_2891:102-755(-)